MVELNNSCPNIRIARLLKKQSFYQFGTISPIYLFHYDSDSCLTNDGQKYHWVIVFKANYIAYYSDYEGVSNKL